MGKAVVALTHPSLQFPVSAPMCASAVFLDCSPHNLDVLYDIRASIWGCCPSRLFVLWTGCRDSLDRFVVCLAANGVDVPVGIGVQSSRIDLELVDEA